MIVTIFKYTYNWACWIAEAILDHFTVDVAVSNIPCLELISTNVMTRATDHTSFIANTRYRYYLLLLVHFHMEI
jgi:hypothetical protein